MPCLFFGLSLSKYDNNHWYICVWKCVLNSYKSQKFLDESRLFLWRQQHADSCLVTVRRYCQMYSGCVWMPMYVCVWWSVCVFPTENLFDNFLDSWPQMRRDWYGLVWFFCNFFGLLNIIRMKFSKIHQKWCKLSPTMNSNMKIDENGGKLHFHQTEVHGSGSETILAYTKALIELIFYTYCYWFINSNWSFFKQS